MINQELINKKIAAMKEQSKNKGGYVEMPRLKLTEGKIQVRILPNKFNKEYPFIETYKYYNFNGKYFLSPITYSEADPISEFCATLSDKTLKKNLSPAYEVFLPVIVRGKENEGVKYWKFGTQVYEQLLNYLANPDWGDITHLETGKDIEIDYTPKEKSKTQYAQTKIMALPNSKPAGTIEQMKEWMGQQIDIIATEKRLTYDEINAELEAYFQSVTPPETQESTQPTETNYNERFDKKPSTEEHKEKLSSDIDDLFK